MGLGEMEAAMTNKNAETIAEETANVVANTSAASHVGGTHFGQEPDAKTTFTKEG